MVEVAPVGGHAVQGLDDAQGAGVLVGAGVAHDADALHGEQDGEVLPEGLVGAGGLDLGGADVVGLLQEVQALGGDVDLWLIIRAKTRDHLHRRTRVNHDDLIHDV